MLESTFVEQLLDTFYYCLVTAINLLAKEALLMLPLIFLMH